MAKSSKPPNSGDAPAPPTGVIEFGAGVFVADAIAFIGVPPYAAVDAGEKSAENDDAAAAAASSRAASARCRAADCSRSSANEERRDVVGSSSSALPSPAMRP